MIDDFLERMRERYEPTPGFHRMMREALTKKPSLIELVERQYQNFDTGRRCLSEIKAITETASEDVFRDRLNKSWNGFIKATMEFEEFIHIYSAL